MAIKTVLIDDFDGSPLSGVSTTTFALNGAKYEIDLSAENAQKLRDALAPFIEAGRRVGGAGAAAKGASRRRAAGRHSNGSNDVSAVRAWAREHGYELGDRGRIPAEILSAYEASK